MEKVQYQATGRRKSSVARVRMVPGTGKFEVNGRNFAEYIPSAAIRLDVLQPLNISDNNIEHIIRTLRGFLEGFVLLVNNNAFGNPISIKESFDLSLDIILNGIKSLEGVK